jgi:hypothetical protein
MKSALLRFSHPRETFFFQIRLYIILSKEGADLFIRKLMMCLVISGVCFSLPLVPPPPQAHAAGQSVKVSLPSYPVTVNGQEIDHVHSKYPFLTYKGITYLPMTWDNLTSLGIEYTWNEEEGMSITTSSRRLAEGDILPLEQTLTDEANRTGPLTAQLSDGSVRIQGNIIDNAAEPYPLLTFRDITYLPLTWQFAHDLLNWRISWDSSNGLSVLGGQQGLGELLGDDKDYLYFRSGLHLNPDKAMLAVNKNSLSIRWGTEEELKEKENSLRNAVIPQSGKPAPELERKGDDLYLGDLRIYSFTKEDLQDYGYAEPVHTYTQFDAGENSVLFHINLTVPLPILGPNYGINHVIWVHNGTVTELGRFNFKPQRVLVNPDGSVWAATTFANSRKGVLSSSAQLALLGKDGTVRWANEELGEADILALGLTNPGLDSAAGPDGELLVSIAGMNDKNYSPQDTAGLYRLTTNLDAVRLTDALYGYYMGVNRDLFVIEGNNTITNWSTGEARTWFDYELLRLE